MIRKYLFYLIRWQLSTPILAVVLLVMTNLGLNSIIATIVANFIGGLIFFWVDKYIFKVKYPVWTLKRGNCEYCGKHARLYRKMRDKKYNAENKRPLYLCERCSEFKDQN